MHFIQITRIGHKSIGYLMHYDAVVLLSAEQVDAALASYINLFDGRVGKIDTCSGLQDTVLFIPNEVDCCYFVPAAVVMEVGGFEEDVEFVASMASEHFSRNLPSVWLSKVEC